MYSCLTSTDNIVLTAYTTEPVSMPLISATSGSYTVPEFTLVSSACVQSDIVYSAVITADSTQSTVFITFETTTRVITWSVPSVAGIYTTYVSGTI